MFFGEAMHYAMRANGVVLVQSDFLLVFACPDHLQVVRSEDVGRHGHISDAVDELNGGAVPIFSEEGYGILSCLDGIKHLVHRGIYEEGVLDLVTLLLGLLIENTGHYLVVVDVLGFFIVCSFLLHGLILFVLQLKGFLGFQLALFLFF